MPRYEYKIVPAPAKAQRIKGLKSPERFALTLEQVMNEMGAEGWQYLRVDTLPQEERSGLASRVQTPRNLLIFQREIEETPKEPPARPVFSRTQADPPLSRRPREATLQDAFDIAEDPDLPDPRAEPPFRR